MQNNISLTIRRTFVSALKCILGDKKAVYASTPITNGPILLEQLLINPNVLRYSKAEYAAFIENEVVVRNIIQAKAFVNRVRSLLQSIVIDPSAFISEFYSQDDYNELWGEVINRFVSEIWFNQGWNYSRGCINEYVIALEKGIPAFDHNGKELLKKSALILINQSIHDFSTIGADVNHLRNGLKRISVINEI